MLSLTDRDTAQAPTRGPAASHYKLVIIETRRILPKQAVSTPLAKRGSPSRTRATQSSRSAYADKRIKHYFLNSERTLEEICVPDTL
ncbi:hypothetical protein EVAR_52304_1 [Eumeta japonica]|uniref:Uncharacterized protein n=1 Tax=Eumeta variegata TaxID=151549 RepID=A0A4C1Y766_EUMVA|nr:hypothetical protein EVAR_52304_1 [Eumeta japonica]